MATTLAVAGLAVSAYGAYNANQNAKAANKPKTGYTDQTSTQQSIYDVGPYIQQILGESQGLYNRTAAAHAGDGGQDLSAFPPGSSARPDGRVIGPSGKQVGMVTPQGGAPRGGGGGGGGKKKKGGGAGNPAGPQSASDFFRAAGNTGLNINQDPLYGGGSNFINQLLGVGRPAGGDQGDPSSNALAYNPVAQDLNERLRGSSLDENDALIRQFLGIGDGGAYGGNGGGGTQRVGSAGGRGSSSGYSRSASGALVGGPPAGGVPDTSQGGGQFNEELARIFDPARLDPANDPTMQPMLDAIQREAQKGLTNSLWDLDAQVAGAGRYGSDAAAFARGTAQGEFGDKLNNAISSTLFSSREANLGRVMQGLGLRNDRDLAAMSDATQREGIRSSSASAGAGLDLQRELANRGMDLEAIGMITQNNQFGMNQLAGLAGQLSADKMGALGMIPDMLGVRLNGAQVANQSGQGLLGKAQLDQQASQYRTSRNDALAQQAKMEQEDALNRYLGRIATIAGLGTTQHTSGTNVVPGAGISPGGAALGAGLGTASSLAGLAGMFSGLGSSSPYGNYGVNGTTAPTPTASNGGIGGFY